MIDLGIIRPWNTPWESPLHMARKNGNNGWRSTDEGWWLNSKITTHRQPLLHIHGLTDTLKGTTVSYKIDSGEAYNKIPMAADDIPRTAFITFSVSTNYCACLSVQEMLQTFFRDLSMTHSGV